MKTAGSRRSFIQSVVGTAAASQLMRLMPHAAFAAGVAPKRLLVVFHPMGYLENSFFPNGEGTSFTLGETQTALNPFKSKLIYVDGIMKGDRPQWLDFETRKKIRDNEHGSGINNVFTGSWIAAQGEYSDSASIDQVVANALYAQTKTAFRSIDLSMASGGGSHGSAFFAAPGEPVKPMRTTSQAWTTLFSQLQLQPATGTENAAFAKAKMQRQRVIDNLRTEFKAVCDRIGSAERQMCEAHLSGILQLEQRQKSLTPDAVSASCSKPNAPAPQQGDPQSEIRARVDLIKSAFACDLSRVATLQIGNADGGVDVVGLANQHGTTHACGDSPSPKVFADHKKWDSWWASQWNYLLGQLDSVQEGNGTMLDNTLILFGSDTTTSQTFSLGAHHSHRFPMWLAGGSNFAFKTGRNIKLPMFKDYHRDGGKWTSNNAMLVSVGRAMGLDINKFGTWDAGQGTVPGLA